MALNEQLAQYPDELVDRVINICNNVFYTDYLQTGTKSTNEQIEDRIKSEIEKTYVAYFGEQHANRISFRVSQTKIHFCYSCNGMRNSITARLDEIKKDNFNKTYGVKFKSPQGFENIAESLETVGLEETKKKSGASFEAVLTDLGITEDMLKDSKTLSEKIGVMRDYGKKYEGTQYSANPKVQEDCLFVKSFCNLVYDKTASELLKTAEEWGINREDAFEFVVSSFSDENWRSLGMDPVACKLMPQEYDRGIMLDNNSSTCAFARPKEQDCFLGVAPFDSTIIHEFGHIIDNGGLEKGHEQIIKVNEGIAYASNTILNEVVTDYCAKEMCDTRQKLGLSPIVSAKEEKSTYEELFSIMKPFLNEFKMEINEARMRPHPAEELARIIGNRQFKDIARETTDLFMLLHDRSVMDIEKLSKIKSGQLENSLEKMDNKPLQSNIDSVLSAIENGGEDFVEWLNANGYLQLSTLVNGVNSLNSVVTSVQKNHVRGTMPPPIFNVKEYNASLSSDQMTMA